MISRRHSSREARQKRAEEIKLNEGICCACVVLGLRAGFGPDGGGGGRRGGGQRQRSEHTCTKLIN